MAVLPCALDTAAVEPCTARGARRWQRPTHSAALLPAQRRHANQQL